jgi:hypothetical protein
MDSRRAEVTQTVERLIDEVSRWPHVTTGEHRFGGTEFRIGPREIGHVHSWGMLDISYLRTLRDVLIEEGQTGVHHLLTESGWTTYYIESADDYEHARWLLRLSYLYHLAVLRKRVGRGGELADVDVDTEVQRLELSDDVLAAFERRST